MNNNFAVFHSVTDFLAFNAPCPYDKRQLSEWTGPRTLAESRDYMRTGASWQETNAARKLVDKIDAEVHESTRTIWKPSPFGAYPIVPDYLAGDPFSMRNKETEQSPAGPVRVVLNISVAAGVTAATIARRGAAMAAFAMKLSEHRPVELWISSAFHNEIKRIDVGWRTRLDMPMNVSQVVASFDRSVCRMINFATLHNLSGCGADDRTATYPFRLKGRDAYHGRDGYMAAFREYMQLAPEDIVLDAGILTDVAAIDRDPVKWVRDMLSKYGEQMDD